MSVDADINGDGFTEDGVFVGAGGNGTDADLAGESERTGTA